MPGKGSEPIAAQGSVWQDPKYRALRGLITRRMREADIDLQLKLKWAKAGFISIPGNLGPVDGDWSDDE